MPRSVVLGNGSMLVCLDRYLQVRDLYYPYVGQENHVNDHTHRIGIWIDGNFSWITNEEKWDISMDYLKDSLVSTSKAVNAQEQIEINFTDMVHHEKNFFLRKITVKNNSDRKRDVRIFLNQHFYISEANIGDTVYYNPMVKSIISYKGKRYFLMNGISEEGRGFDEFATGMSDIAEKKGTYIDAEDGALSNNLIEHGSVDSTLGFKLQVLPGLTKTIYYWIAVAKTQTNVKRVNDFITAITPEHLISDVDKYWKDWVKKHRGGITELSPRLEDMFMRSLLTILTQTDKNGAVIASTDSSILHSKKDTYNYMWPRDGALIMRALDRTGNKEVTKRFFEFCSELLMNEGCLFHKYRPDKSWGSSWHPWLRHGQVQLPIQEDETALVLDALWKWYRQYRDDSFIKSIYKKFIKKAGDFLYEYRDEKTGLPKESYDLWEEKLGIHTFTASTTYAGLRAAENFAKLFGKKKDIDKYNEAAEKMREAIVEHLYDKENKYFIKRLHYNDKGELLKDMTVDISSGYGIFEYDILNVHDEKVVNTMNKVLERLAVNTPIGGYARYENDQYYFTDTKVPGNPWFISALWVAEYYILKARTEQELKPAYDLLNWAASWALQSGLFSEQLHPYTGAPLSVCPLTWSHAGFIIAAMKYNDKLLTLSKR